MKTVEKQAKKGRVGVALFLILFIATVFSSLYIYHQMYFYYEDIVNYLFSTTFDIIFVILFIFIALIHELNHWLSSYSFGIKNKYLGLSPIYWFVSPNFRNNKKYKKSIIILAGACYTIFESIILIAVIIFAFRTFFPLVFLSFAYDYFPIFFEIIYITIIMNLVNLLPIFKDDDGYMVVKQYISSKYINKMMIVVSLILYALIFIVLSVTLSSIFVVIMIGILSIVFYKYGKKILGFKLNSKPGWHKLKLFKITIGYYYKWE